MKSKNTKYKFETDLYDIYLKNSINDRIRPYYKIWYEVARSPNSNHIDMITYFDNRRGMIEFIPIEFKLRLNTHLLSQMVENYIIFGKSMGYTPISQIDKIKKILGDFNNQYEAEFQFYKNNELLRIELNYMKGVRHGRGNQISLYRMGLPSIPENPEGKGNIAEGISYYQIVRSALFNLIQEFPNDGLRIERIYQIIPNRYGIESIKNHSREFANYIKGKLYLKKNQYEFDFERKK